LTSTISSFDIRSYLEMEKSIYGSMNKLQIVNFTNCRINKPISTKFLIKNLSGIKTKFKLNAAAFEPLAHVAPTQKTEI